MAPLVKELQKTSTLLSRVCVTGQHREMLDQVLDIFDIIPDYDLNIMKENQSLTSLTVNAISGINVCIQKCKPDLVLVHGDTSTTLSGALAAFYNKVPVGHVEAGLRTYNKYSPFPEEMNRRLTGNIACMHFVPTIKNQLNLIKEGITEDIYLTGNTVIDSLKYTIKKDYLFKNKILRSINFEEKKYILVTAHRRENLGDPLKNICNAIIRLTEKHNDTSFIYPVHLNPAVRNTVFSLLRSNQNVILIQPIDVQDMHNLINKSYMVMTDSGGLQEEAPALGKPVLVLRTETERPEAVEAGTVKVAGIDENSIYNMANEIISNTEVYKQMANAVNPYGDGKASERIVEAIIKKFA